MGMKESDETLGLKIVTEVVVTRGGVNYDDMLLARTCRHCGNLMLNGSVLDIRGNNNFKIIIRSPDDRLVEMKGAEMLSVTCQCGAFYGIIYFEPANYNGSGVVAYTIIQLDSMKHRLSDRLRDLKKLGNVPSSIDTWVIDALATGFNRAVQVVNEDGVTLVGEDWLESKYSTGWIDE